MLNLFGSPACGKGDLTKGLIKYFSDKDPGKEVLTHDNGEKLRAAAEDKKYTKYVRQCIKDHTAAGTSVPTSISVLVWQGHIAEKHTGENHEILSGMLRQPDEPPLFDSAVKSFYRGYDVYAIYLEVEEEIARRRMLGNNRKNRDDDKYVETVERRLKVFREDSRPIIETLSKALNFPFLRIDGNPSQPEVLVNVLEKIGC